MRKFAGMNRWRSAAAVLFALVSFAAAATGPKVTVIGDSISTYSGYSIYGSYYPYGDVDSVDETWWKQVIDQLGGTLEINAAWSGSACAGSGNDAMCSAYRLDSSRLGNPDLFLVHAGTNDARSNEELGEYIWSDWTASDVLTFRPAFAKLISSLKTAYPAADIMVVVNSSPVDYESICTDVRWQSFATSMVTVAEHYGVMHVELHDISKHTDPWQSTTVQVHPNAAGMTAMATQIVAAYNAAKAGGGSGGGDSGLTREEYVCPVPVTSTGAYEFKVAYTNRFALLLKSSGTLTVGSELSIDRVLAVGGGGSGGGNCGGGGGAGELMIRNGLSLTLVPGDYSVTVGAGGANVSDGKGLNGGDTSATLGLLSVFARGGGGGAAYANNNGIIGGSGGGASGLSSTAGEAYIVSDSFHFGNAGGAGFGWSFYQNGGGGGGAGAVGGSSTSQSACGEGGAGMMSDITGEEVFYAGGGAGGGCMATAASGGTGGGGAGGTNRGDGSGVGGDGLDGRGAGGGGGGGEKTPVGGGAGGDGVIILGGPAVPALSVCRKVYVAASRRLEITLDRPESEAAAAASVKMYWKAGDYEYALDNWTAVDDVAAFAAGQTRVAFSFEVPETAEVIEFASGTRFTASFRVSDLVDIGDDVPGAEGSVTVSSLVPAAATIVARVEYAGFGGTSVSAEWGMRLASAGPASEIPLSPLAGVKGAGEEWVLAPTKLIEGAAYAVRVRFIDENSRSSEQCVTGIVAVANTMSVPGNPTFGAGTMLTDLGDRFRLTFTASDVLTLNSDMTIDQILAVAGGGAGGGNCGGGGGAGEMIDLENVSLTIPAGARTITVGAGGVGASETGANGGDTSIDLTTGTLLARGGGGGGTYGAAAGLAGGSGGGAGGAIYNVKGAGGASLASGAGHYGNAGGSTTGNDLHGAGGGGAGAAGTSAKAGGAGRISGASGALVTYAAGGDGWSSGAGANAAANTGNGGGAGNSGYNGGNGGSGLLILQGSKVVALSTVGTNYLAESRKLVLTLRRGLGGDTAIDAYWTAGEYDPDLSGWTKVEAVASFSGDATVAYAPLTLDETAKYVCFVCGDSRSRVIIVDELVDTSSNLTPISATMNVASSAAGAASLEITVQDAGFMSSSVSAQFGIYAGTNAPAGGIPLSPAVADIVYGASWTTNVTALIPGSPYQVRVRLENASGQFLELTSSFVCSGRTGDLILPFAYSGEKTVHELAGGLMAIELRSSGTMTVTSPFTLSRLLAVGGGGAGGGNTGGGGGAGELVMLDGLAQAVAPGEYSVTIGAGGIGNANFGTNGGDTTATFGDFTVTAAGGGAGGTYSDHSSGASGGSGGGTAGDGGTAGSATATGANHYGNAGGKGSGTYYGGGGGGAGTGGNVGNSTKSGDGGNGLESDITGASRYYAAGGGGASYKGADKYGRGGNSIGGDGAKGTTASVDTMGGNGVDGTGSGGGGGAGGIGGPLGGNGGSGNLILVCPAVVPIEIAAAEINRAGTKLTVTLRRVDTTAAEAVSFCSKAGGYSAAIGDWTVTPTGNSFAAGESEITFTIPIGQAVDMFMFKLGDYTSRALAKSEVAFQKRRGMTVIFR